jgi:hypothetical protein
MTKTLKHCDKCGALATRGEFDYEEIPGLPGEHREFRQRAHERLGCNAHPPESWTYYLDGRKIETSKTRPEWIPHA